MNSRLQLSLAFLTLAHDGDDEAPALQVIRFEGSEVLSQLYRYFECW